MKANPIIICQSAAIAVVAIVLTVFPGENVVTQLLRFMGVGLISAVCYRSTGFAERAGYYTLTVFWLLLAIGISLNIWYFTTYAEGSPTSPVLINDDAATAWAQMTATINGTASDVVSHRQGYGNFLALLAFGRVSHIGTLLCFNMLYVLLAIILTGAATAHMSEENNKARTATVAMIFTGGVCYFLASGAILIKDALCQLIMAVMLFCFYTGRIRMILPIIAATITAGYIRPNLLPFIALATAISIPALSRRRILPVVLFAATLIGAYFWLELQDTLVMPLSTNDGNTTFDLGSNESARLNAYSQVSGSYEDSSLWHKLLLLPFSLCVQFLTPLPWAFGRDIVFGPSLAWSHFSLPWYAFGCIAIFFMVKMRNAPRTISLAFIFGVIAWVVTAFMTGGTVSRYCLPWLPFLVPAATWTVTSGQCRTKTFRYWAIAYSIILAAGLAVVFICINKYSPGGWEAR